MFDVFADKVNDVSYLLGAVWRRRYLIIILGIVVSITGLIVGISSQRYSTQTTILIQDTRTLNPLMRDYSTGQSLSMRFTALSTLLHSRQLLTKSAELLGMITEDMTDKQKFSVITKISKRLKMQLIGSDLITLSYSDASAEDITKKLNMITRLFIVNILYPRTTSARNTEKFIEDQLVKTRDEILRKEQYITNQLATGNNSFGTNPEARMVELFSMRLDTLRERYTDEHSEVKRVSAMLERVKERLAATEQRKAEAETADAADTDKPTAIVASSPDEGLSLREAQNRLEVKRSLYANLLNRHQTAQMSRELTNFESSERVQIIDQARTPLEPATFHPALYMLLGLLLGISGGAVLSIFAELVDTSVKTRNSVEKTTGTRVISRIPAL